MGTYRLLRPVFTAGMALSVILYFVPCYEPSGSTLDAWTATGGAARRLSSFDLCRLLLRTGNVPWGGFYMVCSGAEFILLLLALVRPRRWVFIAGSCEQLYFLIAFLLRPTSGELSQPFFWPLLYGVVWAMTLTGFFVNPTRWDALAKYLTQRLPGGMDYSDAAQLCLRLYTTVDGVPSELLPLSKERLADAFAALASIGWVRDQESAGRYRDGASLAAVTDRGHWLQVIAAIFKKGPTVVDLTRGEELARGVGFVKNAA